MKCNITLTANAGVLLSVGGKEILIDALHDQKVPVFSPVPPEVLEAVWNRYRETPPDLVLTTHTHYDHVSSALWNEARRRWPSSTFISPVAYLPGTIVLGGENRTITAAGIRIDAVRLPHDGAKYSQLFHYGYFLDIGGFTILYPGDCAVAAFDKLPELTAGRPVDLALMNFPWMVLSKPKNFILDVLQPAHIALLHLPFEHDDTEGYRAAAFRAVERLPGLDVRVLCDPLQEIVIA